MPDRDKFRTMVEDSILTNWLQAGIIQQQEVEAGRNVLLNLDPKDLSTALLESWMELANATRPNHLLVVIARPISMN